MSWLVDDVKRAYDVVVFFLWMLLLASVIHGVRELIGPDPLISIVFLLNTTIAGGALVMLRTVRLSGDKLAQRNETLEGRHTELLQLRTEVRNLLREEMYRPGDQK